MEPNQPPGKVWTYDELPDPTDGSRWEIFDGELVVSPAPSIWHQEILKRMYEAFRHLELAKIAKVFFAPLDVVLSPTRVVQPDLLVVRWERRRAFTPRALEEHPDLTVEVLSPSNTAHDRVRKRRFYARNSVPEYWIVDPQDKTVEVLELIDGGLSYRQAGWYASGETARSLQFDVAIEIDTVFADWDD
jgi:Uma2 family endonuclease